jgi:hypothetical protein
LQYFYFNSLVFSFLFVCSCHHHCIIAQKNKQQELFLLNSFKKKDKK